MRVRLRQSRLLELLGRSRLSQNHWAMKLGLSRGHWSDIVNGRHPYPSPKTRQRLLEELGVLFEELFEIEPGPGLPDAGFQEGVLRRYIVDHELGQGGMGTVYVARDRQLGRLVALKVISPEAVGGIGTRQFLREVRYVAGLDHPHILPLHEAGQAAGFPYYVMPYVRGGSLRDRLKRDQRLSVDATLTILAGMSAGLAQAHESHVLHCDVKPENVLLAGDHAYVADFGIARAIHAEALAWGRTSQLDSSAGTPAYVSPEQAAGERDLDARSDVYSLGCVVFEMLAGRPPFTGRSTLDTVSRRFYEPPPDVRAFAPEVPAGVAAVIERAMAVERRDRYAGAPDLLEAIEREAARRLPRLVSGATLAMSRVAGRARRRLHFKGASPLGGSMLRFYQDVRYALRSLIARPAFALVALLTLAIGLGASITVFSVVNAFLLKPLPFAEPDGLMRIALRVPRGGAVIDVSWSYPKAQTFRAAQRVFDRISLFVSEAVNVTGENGVDRVPAELVESSYLPILGIRARLGRFFVDHEDQPGNGAVAVITDGLWRRRFGADPSVLGRPIEVNGRPFAIVGVLPPGFRGLSGEADILLPIAGMRTPAALRQAQTHQYDLVARLKAGVSVARAKATMPQLGRVVDEAYPRAEATPWGMAAYTLDEVRVGGRLRRAVVLLSVAVILVLLIACINVANLTLARGAARRHEIAVRLAVGASHARLVRLLLTESLLLAIGGGALGVGVAALGQRAIVAMSPVQSGAFLAFGGNEDAALARVSLGGMGLDPWVLTFAAAAAVLTALVIGVAPMVAAARIPPIEAVRQSTTSVAVFAGLRRLTGRGILVAAEVALALVLVVTSGLTIRSLNRLLAAPLGYDPRNLLTVRIQLPPGRFTADSAALLWGELLERVRGLPGAFRVAVAFCAPAADDCEGTTITPVGSVAPVQVGRQAVSPDYFKALSIPIVRGRPFTADDRRTSPPVAIINETAARVVWGQADPFRTPIEDDPGGRRVVGIVRDVRYENMEAPPQPTVYVPFAQRPSSRGVLFVRTADPTALIGAVRREVRAVDRTIAAYDVRTMSERIHDATGQSRFVVVLLTVFAMVALALAAVGVYGVLALAVAQRTRELGIRIALGAETGALLRMVVGQAMALAGTGGLFGLLGAAAATRLLRGLLYEVSPSDPVTFVAGAGVLAASALLAALVPAARAARVSPVLALRAE